MIQDIQVNELQEAELKQILKEVSKKIAPLWSLENFVAVNPYLGFADQSFENAMSLLSQRANIKATLPLEFYLKAIEDGQILKEDIEYVLKTKNHRLAGNSDAFIYNLEELGKNDENTDLYKTILDLACAETNKNWERFMIDRITVWGSSYFDQKQASWNAASDLDIYQAWKQEASIDIATNVTGLKGFTDFVKKLPESPLELIKYAIETLELSKEDLDVYLHKLLLRVGGWAAFVARIDWDEGLAGVEGDDVVQFLAILVAWELAVYQSLNNPVLEQAWQGAKKDYGNKILLLKKDVQFENLLLIQTAFDHANQRKLIQKFDSITTQKKEANKSKVQAIFCIDVRSEVFRRHLETASSDIATMGFAGFFAFAIKYVPLAHDFGVNNCPVLLNTSHTINETLPDLKMQTQAIGDRKLKHHLDFAWKSFKQGAISCFSFVGPIGLAYLPKLFTDSYGITRPVPQSENEGLNKNLWAQKGITLKTENNLSGISLNERIKMAEGALKAMSLTSDFASLIMIVGHGSSTVNNPHATGLDCGACGGHTGEANSKVAAAVLNDKEVRLALVEKGIEIPETTWFLACQHDTTTDEVTIFNENIIPFSHTQKLLELKESLQKAGKTARQERALRMNIDAKNVEKEILMRSADWSQTRPEWGLAGCSAFVVAPRSRTKYLDFGGKSFLHSYDWEKDTEFSVLELIMTAPMVVTSWINLQYYASTVDNKHFGSGNKVLHNVVGGFGVLEGRGGDLRTGLPWQSIHDGEKYQNEPLRLNVIIEAPIEAMDKILAKHESVKNLCDNEWIYLFAMDENGKIAYKYTRDHNWVKAA